MEKSEAIIRKAIKQTIKYMGSVEALQELDNPHEKIADIAGIDYSDLFPEYAEETDQAYAEKVEARINEIWASL